MTTDAPVRDGPAPVGDNRPPPEPSPFETIRTHIDDLLLEAHNFADGAGVENQAQADEVSRLIDDLRKAAKFADDQRVAENKPFDDGKAAVQAKYAPLIADPKTKNPGRVWKAIDALKATLKPFLDRLDAEKKAAAELLRQEAEAAALKAAEALRATSVADLAGREAAEDLLSAAEDLMADARRAEKDKAHASGGSRALGLKRTYTPVLVNPGAALRHYAQRRPDDLKAVLLRFAEEDVRNGVRTIPGFTVEEGTRL